MSMTIHSSVKDKKLATPSETFKVENVPVEMLHDLDQQMKKRADDGKKNVVTDALSRKERVKTKRVRAMAMTIQVRWMIYLAVAENIRDAIGFEYYLASSSGWTKKYRSLVLRAEIGESSLTGLELVQETTDKVMPWKGVVRFGKNGKLAPRYVETFGILERIGSIAYRLRLPKELSSVHDTFHVSNLKKKCLADANLHVLLDEIEADKTLRFVKEPVRIMDHEI
nr:hypothetical protein [Tanacetum cinerariifolium]